MNDHNFACMESRAGHERFRALTSSFYRGAQGVILMYDATNRSSFESLGYWLSEIQQHSTNSNVVKMLLGSKLDSAKSKLEVSRSQGEVFAIEHSMLFFEVSSKNGLGISESFTELVQAILDNPVLLRNTTPESVLSPKSRRQLSSNIRSSRRCFFI